MEWHIPLQFSSDMSVRITACDVDERKTVRARGIPRRWLQMLVTNCATKATWRQA